MAKYAAIDSDNIVFDIIEFDIFSGEPIPFENATLVKINDLQTPELGQVWDGENFN